MNVEIKNSGAGSDIGAHVDQNNQLHNFSISQSEAQDANDKGNAYNINTGIIGLTSTSDSAVLFFKNDEPPSNGESTIIIDAIAVGIGTDDAGATRDEKTTITLLRNPTAGTIVTGATDVDMIQNRNFGSSNTLSSTTLAYKGAEANTFTDGDDFAKFFQNTARGYYTIDIELTRGSSLGVKMNTQTSAGTTDIYVALICHRKDGKNS
jgi:hypothetical protein